MERFFIPTEKIQVEHETAWELFFEYTLNSKSSPDRLVKNKSNQHEQQINSKPIRDRGDD